jgi:hypothetical protein
MAAHRENPKNTLRERGPRNNSPRMKTREFAEKTPDKCGSAEGRISRDYDGSEKLVSVAESMKNRWHAHACVGMDRFSTRFQHAHASVGMPPDFSQQKQIKNVLVLAGSGSVAKARCHTVLGNE